MRVSINKSNKENTSLTVHEEINTLMQQELPNSLIKLKEMKELVMTNMTELVFIFDKSGSVSGTEQEMINHFMITINRLKFLYPNTLVTLILFNDKDDIVFFRKKISEIEEFCYNATSGTLLYDTLYKSITKIKKQQLKSFGSIPRTICTIMTDGEDSCSKIYDINAVKKIIEKSKKEGWEFIFLAKNLLQVSEVECMGIEEKNIGVFNSFKNIDKVFSCIDRAINSFYENGSISEDWNLELEEIKKMLSLSSKDGE